MDKSTLIAAALASSVGAGIWWLIQWPGKRLRDWVWKRWPEGRIRRFLLRRYF